VQRGGEHGIDGGEGGGRHGIDDGEGSGWHEIDNVQDGDRRQMMTWKLMMLGQIQ
jgi:hypothetical protein